MWNGKSLKFSYSLEINNTMSFDMGEGGAEHWAMCLGNVDANT